MSVNSLVEAWPIWQRRIFLYSRLEMTHRPKIQQLLAELEDISFSDEGECTGTLP